MIMPSTTLEQKKQVTGILELACREIEITESQFKDAEQKYTAVGNWLNQSSIPELSSSSIYPQGSIRLGTTVKPLAKDEFDVDLICHIPDRDIIEPSVIYDLVGTRLSEHGIYNKILKPLNRGWRIDYTNEFHLDITPAISNSQHTSNSVLVPDKELEDWKPSNPKDYAAWFESIADITPSYYSTVREGKILSKDMEPLPEQQAFKGVLRRIVQILKRHRDVYFQNKSDYEKKCSPISIILTTLAARAYREQVTLNIHDNDIDLLLDVLRSMPKFIEKTNTGNGFLYTIRNPTTTSIYVENFADKWNIKPERATWFNTWHLDAVSSIENMIYGNTAGIDIIGDNLSKLMGDTISTKALSKYTDIINEGRNQRSLGISTIGVISSSASQKIKANTFYGK